LSEQPKKGIRRKGNKEIVTTNKTTTTVTTTLERDRKGIFSTKKKLDLVCHVISFRLIFIANPTIHEIIWENYFRRKEL
jgi:hypothetical protein